MAQAADTHGTGRRSTRHRPQTRRSTHCYRATAHRRAIATWLENTKKLSAKTFPQNRTQGPSGLSTKPQSVFCFCFESSGLAFSEFSPSSYYLMTMYILQLVILTFYHQLSSIFGNYHTYIATNICYKYIILFLQLLPK